MAATFRTPSSAAAPVRKRGPPTPLSLASHTKNQGSCIIIAGPDDPDPVPQLPGTTTSMASTTQEPKPTGPSRNVKRLSLSISSANNSQNASPLSPTVVGALPQPPRRHSVASLPTASVSSVLRRNDEGDSDASAYLDGPIEVMPRVWLGSEDNARDWKGLIERGIKAILNVAKEVSSPFDASQQHPHQPIRNVTSTPNLNSGAHPRHMGTYQPAHLPSGRPGMHYLKMPWSHGQADLVRSGFAEAMQFIDEALARREGVLIHCQCGVSRSATMVIAFVMRAAAVGGPSVPEDVLALRGKGMQAAYDYVQKKSNTIGPNMSLIYQLLDYERALKSDNSPGKSSFTSEDEDWDRRRRELDSPNQESHEILKEAKELDREMEERRARKLSLASSSSNSSLVVQPNPAPWRVRYGSRSRAASMDSNFTSKSSVSVLSEDPLEEEDEDEESEPAKVTTPDTDATDDDVHCFGMKDSQFAHLLPTPTAEIRPSFPPLSAHPTKLSFGIPTCPPSATPHQLSFPTSVSGSSSVSRRSTPPRITLTTTTLEPSLPTAVELTAKKEKRRPPPLKDVSPIVPFPSVEIVREPVPQATPSSVSSSVSFRARRLSSRISSLVPFPMKNALSALASPKPNATMAAPTPSASQTLFVFPPSPRQRGSSTPSVLTLTSTPLLSATFAGIQTPRVGGFRQRTDSRKSWIGVSAPTPTTATARVDARGSFEA